MGNDKVRKATHSSTYKKLAAQRLNKALCFVSSFVVADNLCFEIANFLQQRNVGCIFWGRFLIQKQNPRSIRSVAICSENDEVKQYLADEHGVEVVVIPEEEMING